ncbi:MAG: hypothetical protein P8X84_01905, partial [Candidatus Bathyarchaeota archaeon]
LNQKLSEYILTKLNSESENLISVSKIDFSFGRIRLDDIKFNNKSSNADFFIQGLEFDYNLLNLISNLKYPQKSINKIYLIKPEVILKKKQIGLWGT